MLAALLLLASTAGAPLTWCVEVDSGRITHAPVCGAVNVVVDGGTLVVATSDAGIVDVYAPGEWTHAHRWVFERHVEGGH